MNVTLREFANKHNTILNRRGHKMSESYIYRLIRQDHKGEATRKLWFNYRFEGEKEKIVITVHP